MFRPKVCLAWSFALQLGLSLASSGCANSTSIEHVWRAPGWTTSFEHVLVLGMLKEKGVRRDFETKMAAALGKAGVDATAAFELLPKRDSELSDEELARVLAERGIDGVLVTRLVGVDKQLRYVGGSPYATTGGAPYGFYDYYHYSYDVMYSPGRTVEYDVVTLETSLYAIATADLVWSGLSETFAPSSVEDTIESYAKTMVSALVTDGLVAASPGPSEVNEPTSALNEGRLAAR